MKVFQSYTVIIVLAFNVIAGIAYADILDDTNMLLDWAENTYPQYFSPSGQTTEQWNGWLYRYYPSTNNLAGVNTNDRGVYVLNYPFDRLVYVGSLDEFLSYMRGECSERRGPFATQTTALQRWREAQNQGYAVSNGVFPCYDGQGTRGYCFNVYYSC